MLVPLKLNSIAGKFSYLSLGVIILSSLVSCQTSLIAIEEVSQQKTGKTVHLNGKVVHLAPFVDNAAYQIEDATGKIWVVTNQTQPKIGQQISIKGKIAYQSLPFAEQELGDFYLIELEQLESANNPI